MDGVSVAREIDLPREIVWEALVDPVLVGGWLHPTETLVEGSTPVLFEEPEVVGLPAVLQVDSPAFGDIRIELLARAGGTRGELTLLTVTASGGDEAVGDAVWEQRLDQLEGLLRGHPVDWTRAARRGGR